MVAGHNNPVGFDRVRCNKCIFYFAKRKTNLLRAQDMISEQHVDMH